MKGKKVLLFGGTGLLGTRIKELLESSNSIISPTRHEVNLESQYQIEKFLYKTEYDYIIYAAGVTNPDSVERMREYSYLINAQVVKCIAKRANNSKKQVIYVSTDAVFDGSLSGRSYTEKDKVNPVNYYGMTKAKGEENVLSTSSKNLVVRLIALYTSNFPRKVDFARLILKKLSEKIPCEGIVDQFFNPTFSDDAVYAIEKAIEKKITGILHFGSSDFLSNYTFAKKVADIFGYEPKLIVPVLFSNFFINSKVKRGKFSKLNIQKSKDALGMNVLHTTDVNLKEFRKQITKLKS